MKVISSSAPSAPFTLWGYIIPTAEEATQRLIQFDQTIQTIALKIQDNDRDTLLDFMSIIDSEILPLFQDFKQNAQISDMILYDQLKNSISQSTKKYLKYIPSPQEGFGSHQHSKDLIIQIKKWLGQLFSGRDSSLSILQKDFLRELCLLRQTFIECLNSSLDQQSKYEFQKNNALHQSRFTQFTCNYSLPVFSLLKEEDK